MRPTRDELFDWILTLRPKAKYYLTNSGLSEPDLRVMGVDTSFERFAAENDDQEMAFKREVARLYGAEPANVVVTAGASEAIFLAYAALGDGKRAAVPLPNYPPMFTVPRSLGMKVTNSLDASARGTMFGLTDPNNPTGKKLDEGAVDRVIANASGNEGTVFINETYGEFAFPRRPRTHFGRSERVVTGNTMTKFYGLGRLRVGWILADERRARQLLYAKWAVSGHDSHYSLWIATQVLRKRAKFVERARRIHSRNLKLALRFLGATKGITADLGVAPFCLVRYRRGPASVPLARRILEKAGVLVAPGDFFGTPRSFRLCLTAEEETLRKGLDALSDFLNDSR